LIGVKARQRIAAHRRYLICREQHHAGFHRRSLLRHPAGRGRAVHDRGRLRQHRGRAAPALKPSGGEGRPRQRFAAMIYLAAAVINSR